MEQALAIVVLGAIDAAVLATAAVGFTLQFGVTNYFNFGYGEWLTFGAYIALIVNTQWLHLNVWLALLVAGAVTSLFSVAVNRLIFTPFTLRRREPFYILIVTFGVGFMLHEAYIIFLSTTTQELSVPAAVQYRIGALTLDSNQLVSLGIAVLAMACVYLLLSRTRIGRSMRAVADNRSLAEVCGIRVNRIADATWALTGFLAGIAGVILAVQTAAFNPDLGDNYVYLVFPAVIIGGIGRAEGAMVGALLIGVFGALGALVLPASVSTTLIFIALVVMVVLRPEGLVKGRRPSMQEA